MLWSAALVSGVMLIASAVHPTPAWSQPSERDSVVVLPQASFPPPRVRAWQVGWARPDRIEHASLSFTLATALLLSTRDRSTAGALTLAAGLGKELLDRRGPSGFDGVDLMADAGGIALALTLVRARGD